MQDQLTACTGMYVEEALGGHFQLLLSFVQKADHAAASQVNKQMRVEGLRPDASCTRVA